MEKKLRAKLEEEVRELRAEQKEGFKGNLLPTGAEILVELSVAKLYKKLN